LPYSLPKKQLHTSAVFHERIHSASETFAIDYATIATENGDSRELHAPTNRVRLDLVRKNIINYIRGLNCGHV
jgi:hypothetical protein